MYGGRGSGIYLWNGIYIGGSDNRFYGSFHCTNTHLSTTLITFYISKSHFTGTTNKPSEKRTIVPQFSKMGLVKVPSFLVVILFLINGGSSTTFTVVNQCNYTVWPGLLSGAGTAPLSTTGFSLNTSE